MAESDGGAGVPLDVEADPADQVLAEVGDGLSRRRRDESLDGEFLDAPDGLFCRGLKRVQVPVDDFHAGPPGRIKARSRPAGDFLAGVVVFAVVNAVGEDRPRRGQELIIGGDDLLCGP